MNRFIRMSDAEDDPMAELRERMKNDPNFNPSSDPRMMEALENAIPKPLRDMPVATERLIVAFKDATQGVDALENLDEAAKMVGDEKMISSPQSKWFQQGMPAETYSKSTKASLLSALKKKHPEVKTK